MLILVRFGSQICSELRNTLTCPLKSLNVVSFDSRFLLIFGAFLSQRGQSCFHPGSCEAVHCHNYIQSMMNTGGT